MANPVPELELARLSALYKYGVLDTEADPVFDTIVTDLARCADTPVARVTFVDAARLWIMAGVGSLERELPRQGSLCEAIIDGRPVLVVPDTLRDPMFSSSLAVAYPPHLRAYAGIRLSGPDDDGIGVVSVADVTPRAFDAFHLSALEDAGRQIMILLASRRRGRVDETTGALGRSAFLDQIGRMGAVTLSGGRHLSLVLLDLEPFRTQLERRQAGLGRIVLSRLADLARDQVRRRDSFGRLGENVFGVLLGDTDEAGARILAHRLTHGIAEGWSALIDNREVAPIAVSVASVRSATEGAASLLVRAERTLAATRGAIQGSYGSMVA